MLPEAGSGSSGKVMVMARRTFQRTTTAWGFGIGLLLTTAMISGVSNFVNFRAVQGTNVDAWIAVRNSAVALMLLPLAILLGRGSRARLVQGDWLRLAAIGLLGGAVPFLLYFHGFQMAAAEGGAASASLGYRSLFLIATVLGVLVLRERLPRHFLIGAGLLFGGNVLLLGVTGPVWTSGTALVLLATGLWGCEYAVSKRLLASLPPREVALGRMGFGAVFLLGYLALTGQAGSVATFAPTDWMSLALSALLLFAFVTTWYTGLRTVDLTVASSLLVVGFPITWVLGIVTSGTGAPLVPVAGALAVLAGAALVLWMASPGRDDPRSDGAARAG